MLIPTSAWAYRPFVSTDAAVADPREVEIELGYFNLDRAHRENTISTPHVVLNYGVAKNLELVAEFNLEVSPHVEITDPAVGHLDAAVDLLPPDAGPPHMANRGIDEGVSQ